jgi:hypothetical protein
VREGGGSLLAWLHHNGVGAHKCIRKSHCNCSRSDMVLIIAESAPLLALPLLDFG